MGESFQHKVAPGRGENIPPSLGKNFLSNGPKKKGILSVKKNYATSPKTPSEGDKIVQNPEGRSREIGPEKENWIRNTSQRVEKRIGSGKIPKGEDKLGGEENTSLHNSGKQKRKKIDRGWTTKRDTFP